MSNSSALNDELAPATPESDEILRHGGARGLRASLRFLGFWTAIVLPFVHVPFLLAGLNGPLDITIFLSLVALNVMALYVGHGYEQG